MMKKKKKKKRKKRKKTKITKQNKARKQQHQKTKAKQNKKDKVVCVMEKIFKQFYLLLFKHGFLCQVLGFLMSKKYEWKIITATFFSAVDDDDKDF